MAQYEIIEARKINGVYVSKDDIVTINTYGSLRSIGSATVTGRIQMFQDDYSDESEGYGLLLDISTQYHKKEIQVLYSSIKSIEKTSECILIPVEKKGGLFV